MSSYVEHQLPDILVIGTVDLTQTEATPQKGETTRSTSPLCQGLWAQQRWYLLSLCSPALQRSGMLHCGLVLLLA